MIGGVTENWKLGDGNVGSGDHDIREEIRRESQNPRPLGPIEQARIKGLEGKFNYHSSHEIGLFLILIYAF